MFECVYKILCRNVRDIAEVLIAIAAVAGIVFSALQYNESLASRTQTERAIAATGSIAAEVAKANQQQLRAYVYVAPPTIFHIKEGERPQAYVPIGNSGQTFALKVKRSIGISILSPPTPDKMEDLGLMAPEPGEGVVSPRREHSVVRFARLIPTDDDGRNEVDEIHDEAGRKRIYVFGRVTYEDVFGNQRSTTFCYMYYGPETNPNEKDRSSYLDSQARYCEKFNDAT